MVSLWYLYGIYIGAITEARRDYSLPFALEKGQKSCVPFLTRNHWGKNNC